MSPTPRAREIAPAVDAMLDLYYSQLSQRRDFSPRSSRRTFRIAASEIGHALLFPKLIDVITDMESQIRLRAMPLGLHSLATELETGDTDIAVGAFPKLHAGIHERPLFDEHYVCVVRSDHPSIGTRMGKKEYENAEHIVVSARGLGHVHERIEKELFERFPPERLRVISHNFLVAALLIEKSDYVATVPSRLLSVLGAQHRLRVLPVPIKLPTFKAKMYWHERYHREPSNQWMRQTIARTFSQ